MTHDLRPFHFSGLSEMFLHLNFSPPVENSISQLTAHIRGKKKKKKNNVMEETAGRAHRQDYVKTQI